MSRALLAGCLVLGALALAWVLRASDDARGPQRAGGASSQGPSPRLATAKRAPAEPASTRNARHLLASLRDRDSDVVRGAIQGALAREVLPFDEDLARHLLGWLASENRVRIAWAEQLLLRIGAPVVALLEPLHTSSDPRERLQAMRLVLLFRLNGFPGTPFPPLLGLLRDEDLQVRRSAVALATFGVPFDADVATWVLEGTQPGEPAAEMGPVIVARMGAGGVERLLSLLEGGGEDAILDALYGLRHAPATELKKVLSQVGPFIRAQDEDVAQGAIQSLIALEGDCVEVLPALTAALRHDSVVVLDAALQVLEQMGARAAPAHAEVTRLLEYGHDRIVNRASALLATFKKDPERVMPALARAAHEDVNDSAARALAAYGAAALPHALRAFDEADDDGRYALLLTFAELGAHAAPATGRLIAVLAGDDYDLRQRALHALGRIGPPAAEAVPHIVKRAAEGEDILRLGGALGALARLGPKGEQAVRDMLRTDDIDLRKRMVQILSVRLGETAFALGELGDLTLDPDATVRRRALQAVAVALSDASGRTLRNPDPKLLTRVRALLERGLQDDDPENRAYARLALDEIAAAQSG